MAQNNKRNNGNSNSTSNSTQTSGAVTMSKTELALVEGREDFFAKLNLKKEIEAVQLEIKIVEHTIKLKCKGITSATQREAISLEFQPYIVNYKLQLEELNKREELFTAENMTAIGNNFADKVTDGIKKTPIMGGLSFLNRFNENMKQ